MKHSYKIIITLLALISINAWAGEELSKAYHQTYGVNDNTSLQVSNRFGTIVIENTTEDKMTIDVKVKVEASSQRKAQEILDRIDIIINKVGNTVSAYTEIENASWRGNVELDIDYHIMMPSTVDTQLEMKYGDVRIDQLTGQFNAAIKYGSIKANRLIPANNERVNLEMAYSDASSIGMIGRMNLELAYSDCRIMSGEALVYEIKYSDLELGDVRMINGEMAYSDVEVDLTKNINVEARYSDLNVETLVESIEVEAKYSDVDVDVVEPDFALVLIEATYGDVDLHLSPQANAKVTLESSYGDIAYPAMVIDRSDRDGSDKYIRGYIGQANAKGEVRIVTRYGDIELK